jgi:hypothetical protein
MFTLYGILGIFQLLDAATSVQQPLAYNDIRQTSTTRSSNSVEDVAVQPRRSSLEVITDVISGFLTSTAHTTVNKRKHRLDRPYGESLTNVEALKKIQEKENKTQKRKKAKESTMDTERSQSKR